MTHPPEGDRRAARPPRCSQLSSAASRPSRPRSRRAHGESCLARNDDARELTEEDREWARRTVAALPPLTPRQRDILAMLLRRHR